GGSRGHVRESGQSSRIAGLSPVIVRGAGGKTGVTVGAHAAAEAGDGGVSYAVCRALHGNGSGIGRVIRPGQIHLTVGNGGRCQATGGSRRCERGIGGGIRHIGERRASSRVGRGYFVIIFGTGTQSGVLVTGHIAKDGELAKAHTIR